jgi:hypothetical protein
MHGKIKDDKDTVDPPINDKIGPKFGMDWATNKTAIKMHVRMTNLFKLKSLKNQVEIEF